MSIVTPQGEAAREAVEAEVAHLRAYIPGLLTAVGAMTSPGLLSTCSSFAQSAVRTAIWDLLTAGTMSAHHDGELIFTVAGGAGSVEAKLEAAETRLRGLRALHGDGRIHLMEWDKEADERRGGFVRDYSPDIDILLDDSE